MTTSVSNYIAIPQHCEIFESFMRNGDLLNSDTSVAMWYCGGSAFFGAAGLGR